VISIHPGEVLKKVDGAALVVNRVQTLEDPDAVAEDEVLACQVSMHGNNGCSCFEEWIMLS
jgi:hypothetical protein